MYLPTKKRPKGKNMSDGKIMCTDEGDTKAKVFFLLIQWQAEVVVWKNGNCLILMAPSF